MVKNPPANAGGMGLIPGLGRSPEEGKGNPLQNSCLGNPIEEPGGLQSMGLQKSWTWLSDETTTTIALEQKQTRAFFHLFHSLRLNLHFSITTFSNWRTIALQHCVSFCWTTCIHFSPPSRASLPPHQLCLLVTESCFSVFLYLELSFVPLATSSPNCSDYTEL